MTQYTAGWNMPGYMPDNTPEVFEDLDSAKRYLLAELDLHWNQDYEGADAGETDGSVRHKAKLAIDGSYLPAVTELNLTSESDGWSAIVGKYVYWLNATEEE